MQSSSLVTDQRSVSFSHDEIRSATLNFNEASVIGRGGFGKVYKGCIKNGSTSTNVVAIKQLSSMSKQGFTEFRAEVEMLSQIRHCNLVSLIGYCDEGQDMALVYEYMPHGTLEEHLHKTNYSLSWVQRLKICIGVARGLDYLHTGTGTRHGIIHRDVKSSNILLDENFEARISDFGLAKIGPANQAKMHVSTGVKGTFGYMDPAYYYTGELTRKSDVYSFGVVLLEVMCGRPAVDSNLKEDMGLASWALSHIKKGKINNIIDRRIRGQISNRCIKDFANIARSCLDSEPNKRPTVAEIVSKIEVILSLQVRHNSSLSNGKFIDKILSFFSGKSATLTSAGTPGDESYVTSPQGPLIYSSSTRRTNANLRIFSFHELLIATRNFRHGTFTLQGHSEVYKGWIDEPSLAAAKPGALTLVAVKKFKMDNHQEWLGELTYLGKKLSHPNLLKLIGYHGYYQEYPGILVYEFMSRGSLEDQLFRRGSYLETLSWGRRIKIALGAANGLAYLHSPEAKVIFRGLTSSSILIDSNYNAKIYKFRFAKDVPQDGKNDSIEVIGFDGYTDPEYLATGRLSTQSDIYSFGVVLLEIMTGRRCLDKNRPHDEQILTEFVKPYLESKKVRRIMEPRIDGQYELAVAMKVAILAKKCLFEESTDRPTADEVVQALEQLQYEGKTRL